MRILHSLFLTQDGLSKRVLILANRLGILLVVEPPLCSGTSLLRAASSKDSLHNLSLLNLRVPELLLSNLRLCGSIPSSDKSLDELHVKFPSNPNRHYKQHQQLSKPLLA